MLFWSFVRLVVGFVWVGLFCLVFLTGWQYLNCLLVLFVFGLKSLSSPCCVGIT